MRRTATKVEPRHIMLDLETLGTTPGCVVLSIGAVAFSQTKGIVERFAVAINPRSCMKAGLTIDPGTMYWWMRQPKTAQEAAMPELCERDFPVQYVNLKEALDSFKTFYWGHSGQIWGDGAAFDQPILAAAYCAVGDTQPWGYQSVRCFRTVRAMFPDVKWKVPRHLVPHVGVDDAEAQALHLLKIAKKKGLVLV